MVLYDCIVPHLYTSTCPEQPTLKVIRFCAESMSPTVLMMALLDPVQWSGIPHSWMQVTASPPLPTLSLSVMVSILLSI